MNYKKPEIDILMFMNSDVITGSLDIMEKDPINGGGDLDYDADANGV